MLVPGSQLVANPKEHSVVVVTSTQDHDGVERNEKEQKMKVVCRQSFVQVGTKMDES